MHLCGGIPRRGADFGVFGHIGSAGSGHKLPRGKTAGVLKGGGAAAVYGHYSANRK